MIEQARSSATRSNRLVRPLKRQRGERNTAWVARAAGSLPPQHDEPACYVLLLGGADQLSFRLRVAQSHLRDDLLPSYWSHSLLLDGDPHVAEALTAIDVPLDGLCGPGFPPSTNGVRRRAVADFDEPSGYGNLALLRLPVDAAAAVEAVQRFMLRSSTLDALDHALRWLAYAWGVAGASNPLRAGIGLPSSCMLDVVLARNGFDLTPGLEARAACPEAIWSAALHWWTFYEAQRNGVPAGRFVTDHVYPIIKPDGSI
jgi:hypothetical protein